MRVSSICGYIAVAAVVILSGCGEKDGLKELKDGWTAFELHDLKKADRLFSKSIGYNAENVDALVASVRVKLELGELSAAKEVWERAAECAADDDDVILLGAQLAYHAKDYKRAAKAFTDFAQDSKRDAALRADAYVGLAVVEMTCSEHVRARIALLKALLLDRRSPSARYHLGLLYRTIGYEEAALEQFEAYVMLDKVADLRMQRVQRQVIPGLKDAIARKAMSRPGVEKRDSAAASRLLQSAEAEAKKGNYKKAKGHYADAFKADSLSYPAALGLAVSWEKTDSSPAGKRNALTCYQTAASLKPGAIKTLMKTGTLASSLGNVAVATEAYSRVLAADPKSIEAIDALIRALRKSGASGARDATEWQEYRNMLKGKK